MRVLHIVSWYPNKGNPNEGIFIRRHIESLSEISSIEQKVIHLDVSSNRLKFIVEESFTAKHILIGLPVKTWLLLEVISLFFLLGVLTLYRANRYDIINFHIAYPNLTYWHWLKRWIKPKVVISEHWSAYHFNFGLKIPPPRIQRIFQQDIPVIAVSNALLSDIRKFSNASFDGHIVPNVVDTSIFKNSQHVKRDKHRFFMVAQWKKPKNPMVVLRAFKLFLELNNEAELIVGGYGPMLKDMKKLVGDLNISSNVRFSGKMSAHEIAFEMQKATAYLHCSDYETFSVVCAEALSCGCPVIASNVGGIKEFVDYDNGLLVNSNTPEAFYEALERVKMLDFNFKKIDKFFPEKVGEKYHEVLSEIIK